MRIALGQINLTVGDVSGNVERCLHAVEQAHAQSAQVLVLPELAISGYPPEDLLLRPAFLRACEVGLERLARSIAQLGDSAPVVIVGVPQLRPTGLVNSVAVIDGVHGVAGRYDKMHLPNYAVFDERRYFRPGSRPGLVDVAGERLGLTICEDSWIPDGPMNRLAAAGCSVILNASASPYHMGKPDERERMLAQRARDTASFVVYCNLVGGQDELVFDGGSLVLDPSGRVIARGRLAEEQLIVVDIDPAEAHRHRLGDVRVRELSERVNADGEALDGLHVITARSTAPQAAELAEIAQAQWPEPIEELWRVLALGLADYVRKSGFERVLIGVSGGIDSAVVAALAADALGPDAVMGVTMPTRYNSSDTISDAHRLMSALDLAEAHCGRELAIGSIVESYQAAGIAQSGLAAQNIQSRVRGNVLMGLSNEIGALVLACGNKSEYAVGYATLYGDTCGGYAPLRDVGKLRVFELARHANERACLELIPMSIIDRPPSAELAEDQEDTDVLPPYEQLDPLLERVVEQDADGIDERIERLVLLAEYKRRQAPPGPKVSPKAFGRDRRMPIADGWLGEPLRRAP